MSKPWRTCARGRCVGWYRSRSAWALIHAPALQSPILHHPHSAAGSVRQPHVRPGANSGSTGTSLSPHSTASSLSARWHLRLNVP
jgi:hypothetical protein